MGKHGQSSIEYLFIVAMSLMLVIPATFLFLSYSKTSEEAVVAAQIHRGGNEILSKVEEMYVIGNNSWTTLELSLPDDIINATIYTESEMSIFFNTQLGISEAVFFSDINITNGTSCLTSCVVDLIAGNNFIKITSKGDHVSIVRT